MSSRMRRVEILRDGEVVGRAEGLRAEIREGEPCDAAGGVRHRHDAALDGELRRFPAAAAGELVERLVERRAGRSSAGTW